MIYYSIFDKKAKTYASPFPALNDSVAIRMVSVSATGESLLAQYPEDFSIFRVGTFSEETGVFSPNDVPDFVSNVVVPHD